MTIGVYMQPSNFTVEKYDEAFKRIDSTAGALQGMLYHCAMEADGKITVFDVWESEAAFAKFGETLVPTLAELGVDPGQPMIMPVHNMLKG